jgi:hypothetical protein
LAIGSARGGFDHQFSTAIAIEVVDDKRNVMGSGTDVRTHVDAPKERAIETVTVEERGTGIAIVRVIAGIGRFPLQDDLILSVAIDISHAGIVGGISIFACIAPLPALTALTVTVLGRGCTLHDRHLPPFGLLQLEREVAHGSVGTKGELTSRRHRSSLGMRNTHLVDGIFVLERVLIEEEGATFGEGLLCEAHAIAVYIEGLLFLVVA